jgi:hypothetical protein
MKATLAEEELRRAEALLESERTRMAGINLPLDRYNLLGSVTHTHLRAHSHWLGSRNGSHYYK